MLDRDYEEDYNYKGEVDFEEEYEVEYEDEYEDEYEEEGYEEEAEYEEDGYEEEDDDDEEDSYEEDSYEEEYKSDYEEDNLGDELLNETSDVENNEQGQLKDIQGFSDNGFVQLAAGSYTIKPTSEINIKDIAFNEPTKIARQKTLIGLTKTIGQMGVLQPIHVLKMEEYTEEEKEMLIEDGEELPPQYLLMDGFRRVYGSLKNNLETIPAMVWVFKDIELGKKLAFDIGVWLNKAEKHVWSEIWDIYQILEERSQVKPAMFEFLFSLDAGDALKLKEVMLGEYEEPKMQLLGNEKTLDACYKALIKLRKEEDSLEKADATGIDDTAQGADEITEGAPTIEGIDDQKVRELMELSNNTDLLDVDGDDFNELNEDIITTQDPKNRTFTDPRVKKAALVRDNFTCQTCGTGGPAFLDVIIGHHKWPVSTGGPDTIENLLALCDTCHLTLHTAQYNKGRLPMTQQQFEDYSEEQQIRIKKILKLAKFAYEASKSSGLSPEQIQELAKAEITHRKPGENIKENLAIYKDWKNGTTEIEDMANAQDRLKERVGKIEKEVVAE